MKHYISDTHFTHKRCLEFDKRPFASADEMDEQMIGMWNKAVKKSDSVYILGDFCWSNDRETWKSILKRLNGDKFLIRGNHDKVHMDEELGNMFVWVKDYAEIKDEGRGVVLSHYPIPFYNGNRCDNYYMLFGHIHNNAENDIMAEFIKSIFIDKRSESRGNLYNVGCMLPYMGYTPRTLSHIIENGRTLT